VYSLAVDSNYCVESDVQWFVLGSFLSFWCLMNVCRVLLALQQVAHNIYSSSLFIYSFADGGKCLKILKTYVGNVVDNPEEEKFKSVNMENKTFKSKVKPFIGAKNLLIAVGFKKNEKGDALVLEDDADTELLAATKAKLEKAMVAYG
jgi:hypothetical protein